MFCVVLVERLVECLICTTMRTEIMPPSPIDKCVCRTMARTLGKPVGSPRRSPRKFRSCSACIPILPSWRLAAVQGDMLCILRKQSVAKSWDWISTNPGSEVPKNSPGREGLLHEHVLNNATFQRIFLLTT